MNFKYVENISYNIFNFTAVMQDGETQRVVFNVTRIKTK